ncbi:MAG: hypothetical protein AAB116_15150 [Candidatus Poribacteria bacterium]
MDPIIEEIRRYRDEYAKSHNYDLYKIYQDLKEKQEKSGRRIASFPSKPAKFFIKQESRLSSQVL